MICKNCGKENSDDVFICEGCGNPLDIIMDNPETNKVISSDNQYTLDDDFLSSNVENNEYDKRPHMGRIHNPKLQKTLVGCGVGCGSIIVLFIILVIIVSVSLSASYKKSRQGQPEPPVISYETTTQEDFYDFVDIKIVRDISQIDIDDMYACGEIIGVSYNSGTKKLTLNTNLNLNIILQTNKDKNIFAAYMYHKIYVPKDYVLESDGLNLYTIGVYIIDENYETNNESEAFFKLVYDGEEYTGTMDGIVSDTDVYFTNSKKEIPDRFDLVGDFYVNDTIIDSNGNIKQISIKGMMSDETYAINGKNLDKLYEDLINNNYTLYVTDDYYRIGDILSVFEICFYSEDAGK